MWPIVEALHYRKDLKRSRAWQNLRELHCINKRAISKLFVFEGKGIRGRSGRQRRLGASYITGRMRLDQCWAPSVTYVLSGVLVALLGESQCDRVTHHRMIMINEQRKASDQEEHVHDYDVWSRWTWTCASYAIRRIRQIDDKIQFKLTLRLLFTTSCAVLST